MPVTRIIRFRFCTPTTFRQGDLDLPLPVPALVFKSLLDLWNLHAPKPIVLGPHALERGLALASCRIRTRRFFDGHAFIPGFVGLCEFRLTKVLSDEEAAAVRALAAFAFFSGIGRKTTHGMGLVRVDFGGKSWPS
ncbi:MAG: CRISPR system precrRNA processing endoribonuclease RAMP protein Cas6 [Clostridia bacterium]|nr:CRISPR system precrRNA processing endoribonuclease RAMP protein Cas6 [Clostridia bacterium]